MDDRLRLYSQREVQELYKTGRKIFGAPLPMPHPRSKHLPPSDALRGLLGEHAVSGLLNLLTLSYPEMYIFHSVGISDDEAGETDHIIVCNNRIFIVETKNYSSFSTVFADVNGITQGRKNGQVVTVNDNNIVKKIQFYKKLYPDLLVEGVLVITSPDVNIGSSYSGYNIANINTLIPLITAKQKTSVPPKDGVKGMLIKRFANLCIRNENIH